MKKINLLVTAVLMLSISTGHALAQQDFSKVEISIEEVKDGIYFLQGSGGNIGLSIGKDGAFLIDDQFAPLTDKIQAAIASVTDANVEFLVNTHHHSDHTGGNENFGGSGTRIVAHANVRSRLPGNWSKPDVEGTDQAHDAALPVITFSDSVTFHWNGHEIHVFHDGKAHTDGDSLVYFKDADVLHAGDIFLNGGFPLIHVSGGGDVDGYIGTLETILTKITDETIIIAGHGPLGRKSDLVEILTLLKDVRGRIHGLIEAGKTVDESIALNPLSDLNDRWGKGYVSSDAMVRSVYKSLTQK